MKGLFGQGIQHSMQFHCMNDISSILDLTFRSIFQTGSRLLPGVKPVGSEALDRSPEIAQV